MPGRKSPLVIMLDPAEQSGALAHDPQWRGTAGTHYPAFGRWRGDHAHGLAGGRATGASCALGAIGSSHTVCQACKTCRVPAARRSSRPEVTVHLVKRVCERPDPLGRSLSQYDCMEMARQLERSGVVEGISCETGRRILEYHKLKLWRNQMWL